MTLSTHTAIGATIGFYMGNPILGFILGILSHLLVDMIPHGDYAFAQALMARKGNLKLPLTLLSLDAAVAISILLFVMNFFDFAHVFAFTATIAGSIIPDIINGIYEITKSKYLKWFTDIHFFFHDYFVKKYGDVKLKHAASAQVAFIATILIVVTSNWN